MIRLEVDTKEEVAREEEATDAYDWMEEYINPWNINYDLTDEKDKWQEAVQFRTESKFKFYGDYGYLSWSESESHCNAM